MIVEQVESCYLGKGRSVQITFDATFSRLLQLVQTSGDFLLFFQHFRQRLLDLVARLSFEVVDAADVPLLVLDFFVFVERVV